MSGFKFQLGDIVISKCRRKHKARIEAMHLHGFMRVQGLADGLAYMVRDADYELYEEEIVEMDIRSA